MLKANPRLTPDQLEAILKETARPLEQTGTLKQVDVVRAIARAAATADPRTR
jgi:isopentenyl diphosphate isomerase/L-lactate dehydrogenase-like FMN-dependent dehydrogenase